MTSPEHHSADVIVFGATAGGVVAAVAAAREGASVLIVEPSRHVGGMLTGGLSRTDVERQEGLIGGLAGEVFRRIGERYGAAIGWRFEPHVASAVLGELLGGAGVEVVTAGEPTDVDVADRRVRTLRTVTRGTFEAHTWIDASYEGDLLAAAGASFAVGREARSLHGETLAGRREILPSPHQARVPVSALDEAGVLLPRLVPYEAIGLPGDGDGKVQAYCHRIVLSAAPDRRPLAPPEGYERGRYSVVERYLRALVAAGIGPTMHDAIGMSELPNGKIDVNSHGPFSTNLPGTGRSYLESGPDRRDAIRAEHRDWARGLLHFLANDAAVPAAIGDLLAPYGYPADEFVETEGFPPQLYVREARRLRGEHVLSEADLLGGRVPGDTIGLGGYNVDIREVQWVACPISRFPEVHREVLVEGYLSVPVAPFGIPYRSLLPRRSEIENVLVSTCLSSSAVAFSSVRMEPQFMIAGHAAGIAAAEAARRDVAAHDVDTERLRARLAAAGQVLRPG